MHKVNNPLVAAFWADQWRGEASNEGGTFFFKGETIYSYGAHFPIARHVWNKDGRAVLLTLRTYGTTTAKHVSLVRQACPHLRVFNVMDIDARSGVQFRYYRKQLRAMVAAYAKARVNGNVRPKILDAARSLTVDANDYAAFFGLKSRLSLTAEMAADAIIGRSGK